jgi:hypothetical protein
MKSLPVRSTRGKRVAELIGEEKEYDDLFWGQELFKEAEEADEEYVTESEPEDVFDADFFKAESSEEEAEAEVKEAKEAKVKSVKEHERRKKRRRMAVSMKSFTQTQMLEDAALTELLNLHALKVAGGLLDSNDHLASRKRRALPPPVERCLSKGQAPAIYTFSLVPEYPKPSAVPSKKGKYLDPVTGKRYSTSSEFRALRESHFRAMETDLKRLAMQT